jgi:hypothetical protein
MRRVALASFVLFACKGGGGAGDEVGSDDASSSGGPTVGSTPGTTVSDSSGDASATMTTSVDGTDSADTTAGETEEPPPPDCEGIGPAVDALGTRPGESTIMSPTLEHVTVQWLIEGDSNENGATTVRWRERGGAWHEGTMLRRTPAGTAEGFAWDNKHAGTVFGLSPGTDYEIELALADPDGGCEIRTLNASTRPVPAAMDGAPVIAVDPGSFPAALDAAMPGDILDLAPGNYDTFTVFADGSEDAPIVIRAASDGVIIDGEVRLDGRSRGARPDQVQRLARAVVHQEPRDHGRRRHRHQDAQREPLHRRQRRRRRNGVGRDLARGRR